MAAALLLMITSGLAFDNLEMSKSLKFNMYQWHKSLGILLLLAVTFRIIWRILHYPPQMPNQFSRLDKILGKIGHIALYVGMILMPITGWVMVSSSAYGLPTIIFGWFEWPHIPELSGNKFLNTISKTMHEFIAYGFIVLVVIHVGAVIKHAKYDGVNLLKRMLWSCDKNNENNNN